jgi:chromosome segregation ATPase
VTFDERGEEALMAVGRMREEVERLRAENVRLDRVITCAAHQGFENLVAERDQARADLAQAVEDRERLRGQVKQLRGERDEALAACEEEDFALENTTAFVNQLRDERDRLRAVFDALAPVIGEVRDASEVDTHYEALVAAFDRARAGLEPTP